jgi:hypothetical protein
MFRGGLHKLTLETSDRTLETSSEIRVQLDASKTVGHQDLYNGGSLKVRPLPRRGTS